jgi:hypothetical protein
MIIMKKVLIIFSAIFLIKNSNSMECNESIINKSEQFKIFFIENERKESIYLNLLNAHYESIPQFIYADCIRDLEITSDQYNKLKLKAGKSAYILLLSEFSEQNYLEFPLFLKTYSKIGEYADWILCRVYESDDRKTMVITSKYQEDFGKIPVVNIKNSDGTEEIRAYPNYLNGCHVTHDKDKNKFIHIN